MTILFSVPENSTVFMNVKHYNKYHILEVPTSATWEVHDEYTNQVMQVPIALPAGSNVDVTIPSTVNVIVNQNNPKEIRVITIKAIFGADFHDEEITYLVRNLIYVP